MAALTNLGMRIQETFSEHTRDLAFVGKSPNATYFDTGEDKVRKISRQLDSSHERETLEGMKRLVALISKGRNVSEFFAQVVKKVGSHNLEIRKLVYIYLLRYTDAEPDLALLSINTFQKDLSDSNPLIRAMALRVLSGIRVPMIISIVVLGIKKCASDTSPYVRKAAALAIPKAYRLDSAQLPALMPILQGLLRDRSPLSIGAVAVAFNAVCPTRLDLLHQHYRRLCRTLTDADEWGQVHLLDLLGRYARAMLSPPPNDDTDMDPDLKLLLDCAEPLFQSRNPSVAMAVVRLFYYLGTAAARAKVINPLLGLMHRSPEVEQVVLGNLLIISREHKDMLVRYMSRFFVRANDLPNTKRVKVQILTNLVTANNVDVLIQEFKEYALDIDEQLVADAIQAIGRCARAVPETSERCFAALLTFIKSKHDPTVSNAILVLKSLYQYQSAASGSANKSLIISGLARRLDSIRHPAARSCVVWLVGQYANADGGSTTVVPGIEDWAPDVLRKVAKSFAEESEPVRLQAVVLAAKLLVLAPSADIIRLLAQYVFSQARYDASYDVRDRARTLVALLKGLALDLDGSVEEERINDEDVAVSDDVWERRARQAEAENEAGVVLRVEQARLVLFGGKGPVASDDEAGFESGVPTGAFMLGSVGVVIGKTLYGDFDRRFQDWHGEGTDSSLRDSPDDAPPAPPPLQAFGSTTHPRGPSTPVVLTPTNSVRTNGAGSSHVLAPARASVVNAAPSDEQPKWKDLDAFYADDDDESSEEEEDEEDEEDDSSEEEDDEDEPETADSDGRSEHASIHSGKSSVSATPALRPSSPFPGNEADYDSHDANWR